MEYDLQPILLYNLKIENLYNQLYKHHLITEIILVPRSFWSGHVIILATSQSTYNTYTNILPYKRCPTSGQSYVHWTPLHRCTLHHLTESLLRPDWPTDQLFLQNSPHTVNIKVSPLLFSLHKPLIQYFFIKNYNISCSYDFIQYYFFIIKEDNNFLLGWTRFVCV